MEFSPQQNKALQQVNEWLRSGTKSKPFFYLAGFAGTGKTTLAKHLAEHANGEVFFAAYTGKAALQLRKSGCPNTSTVHSLTYAFVPPDEKQVAELKEKLNKVTDPTQRTTIIAELNDLGKPQFVLNEKSPLANNPPPALLVLDECSMINEEMAQDLLSFEVPILVLGDPGQLPPVSGAGYFTNGVPDFTLTEIHRQAKDNPIIALSMHIREYGNVPVNFSAESGGFGAIYASAARLQGYDQILVGKNKTRILRNQMLRQLKGYSSTFPVEGDKLIILRNDRKRGLFNGLFATACSTPSKDKSVNFSFELDFETELRVREEGMEIFSGHFEEYTTPGILKEIPYYLKKDKVEMDYGYAITVHKAQGSQWPHVLVIDDGMYNWGPKHADARKQWLYTAVTRAQESVKVVRMRQ